MARTSDLLNERRKTLLNLIVEQYVSTAAPVGSEAIARQRPLQVSPATVRNDMAELEKEGYISRPHTSAGGVPTDKAYRFFVENLAETLRPPASMQTLVRDRFREAEQDLEKWVRVAVAILSRVVHNVAIASLPRAERSRIKHVELVQLQEFLILLILVLQEARLHQHILTVSEPVTQDALTAMANKLNSAIAGKTSDQVVAQLPEGAPLEKQVLRETAHLLETADREAYEDHYMEGLRHILEQPEFSVGSRARQAVEVLEDRRVVREILAQVPEYGTVRVIIGAENNLDSLHPFSLVVCQYGVPGQATGSVSAVGPTRMDYATVIAGVQYLSRVMSRMVSTLHGRS